jgi:hypothetical protein
LCERHPPRRSFGRLRLRSGTARTVKPRLPFLDPVFATQASQFVLHPAEDLLLARVSVEVPGPTPLKRDPAERWSRNSCSVRHHPVRASDPGAKDPSAGHSDDEGDPRLERKQLAGRALLAFREDAHHFSGLHQARRPADGGAIRFPSLDGECPKRSGERADQRHLEQLALGHEVDGPGASVLDEDRIDVRDVVREDEEATPPGDLSSTVDAGRSQQGEQDRRDQPRERQSEESEPGPVALPRAPTFPLGTVTHRAPF